MAAKQPKHELRAASKPGRGSSSVTRKTACTWLPFAACCLAAVTCFIVDLNLQLGVAAGVPYIVVVVGIAFASRCKRLTIGMASVVSALVVVGYFLSAPAGESWIVVTNRVLAIGAICTVTALCIHVVQHINDQTQLNVHIVDSSPVGMVMVNQQGQMILVNKAIEELFGYSCDELLGQPVELLVPERLREEHSGYRRRFFADSSVRPMGVKVSVFGRHKSGTEIPIDIGLNPVDSKGELCVLGTIIDLREQKRIERELEIQALELSRTNEDLEQFAYVASHDLKSPLRAIDNLAKWIVEDVGDGLPEKSKKHLRQLQGRIGRMEALLDDLLAYSRAGRKPEEKGFIECSSLIQEIIETLSIPDEFRVVVEANLPSLHARQSALRQVLMNLICNAIKHHDRSDGCVTLRAFEGDSAVEFIIEDDGPGIASEFHERAFKPFQTLQPRDQIDGTGLGLAIVRRLVENEGGSIQLSSEVGKGAHFRVTWPKELQVETANCCG